MEMIEPEKLPKNIFYRKRTGDYVYQKTFNGKRCVYSRKKFSDVLEVKNKVESHFKSYGKLPIINNPHQKIDYKGELPVGSKIGEWTIIGVKNKTNRLYAICQCSCGVKREVYYPSLYKRKSLSCGHLLSTAMTTSEFQEYAHSIQRKRREPNIDNKLGERNVSLDKRGRYWVNITRYGFMVRQSFNKLDEAIAFRDKLLEDIENNNGHIPQFYSTKKRTNKTKFSRKT